LIKGCLLTYLLCRVRPRQIGNWSDVTISLYFQLKSDWIFIHHRRRGPLCHDCYKLWVNAVK